MRHFMSRAIAVAGGRKTVSATGTTYGTVIEKVEDQGFETKPISPKGYGFLVYHMSFHAYIDWPADTVSDSTFKLNKQAEYLPKRITWAQYEGDFVEDANKWVRDLSGKIPSIQ